MKRGNSYVIKISLHEKDKTFLKMISKHLSDYEVKEYTTLSNISKSGVIKSCEITFRSEKMYNDLINKGCFPKKSLILKFPTDEQVPFAFIHHFIRGYFDGDGSISVFKAFNKLRNKHYTVAEVNICGTLEFLQEVSKILNMTKSCVYKEKRRVGNIYKLKFHNRPRVENFYTIVYKDCHIQLNRKQEIFKNYLQERCSTTIIDNPEMG
jgi:NDP-sugar pyrophosphorylase family protein